MENKKIKIDFQKRSKVLDIAGKEYEICISDYDFIKKCQNGLVGITQAQEKLNKEGDIDTLIDASKELINLMLNNDFDRIWMACHKDIFNLLDLCGTLSELIKEGFTYKANKY